MFTILNSGQGAPHREVTVPGPHSGAVGGEGGGPKLEGGYPPDRWLMAIELAVLHRTCMSAGCACAGYTELKLSSRWNCHYVNVEYCFQTHHVHSIPFAPSPCVVSEYGIKATCRDTRWMNIAVCPNAGKGRSHIQITNFTYLEYQKFEFDFNAGWQSRSPVASQAQHVHCTSFNSSTSIFTVHRPPQYGGLTIARDWR